MMDVFGSLVLAYTVLEPRESVDKAIVEILGGGLTGVQLSSFTILSSSPDLDYRFHLVPERHRHAGSGETGRRQRLQPSIREWWRKGVMERKVFQWEGGGNEEVLYILVSTARRDKVGSE